MTPEREREEEERKRKKREIERRERQRERKKRERRTSPLLQLVDQFILGQGRLEEFDLIALFLQQVTPGRIDVLE